MPSAGNEPAASDVLSLLRRYGRTATSFHAVAPGLRRWIERRGAAPSGCVAYVDTGQAWVAAGAPIAAPDEVWRVGERFARAADAAGRRAVFVCAERWATDAAWLRTLPIGEQPVWDPSSWPAVLDGAPGLRAQVRRAQRAGVRARPVAAADIADRATAVRRAAERLIDRWLATRAMAPMGFLVRVRPFELPEERRYFVAERDARLIGLIAAVPIYQRGGWLLQDFVRDPAAPNGTMELLFGEAMRGLAAERAGHATLGLAPLAGVGGGLAAIRDVTGWLYDFEGLRAWKSKLRPHGWEPVYLAWPRGRGAIGPTLDCLRAFAHGSFRRFAGATLAHRGRALAARG